MQRPARGASKTVGLLALAWTLGASVACSDSRPADPTGDDPGGAAASPLVLAATSRGMSAIRGTRETYEVAHDRVAADHAEAGAADAGVHETAYESRLPIADVDFSVVPDWGTESKVKEGFDAIRDPRWLSTTKMERRESWLYPDDGCFARAALAGQRLESDGYARPYKLFVFGDLVVQTANAPQKKKACPPWGEVSWWYHVVPVVRVGAKVMVLDPAVEPYGPLEVREWVARVNSASEGGPESGITLSVCDPYTYDPSSGCLHAKAADEGSALSDEDYYLKLEWQRQVALDREPKVVLGPKPPWKTGDWLEFDAGSCDAGRP